MEHITGLKCMICGKKYHVDDIDYVCPLHGDEGIVDVEYDYDQIGRMIKRDDLLQSKDNSMWRYKPFLPIAQDAVLPPLSAGWTPIYKNSAIAEELGLREVWIKDEGRMPTGSLKDRASSVAVVKAREAHAKIITTASTGNAAAALSGICASAGQPNVIFVPEKAPQAKIAQLLVFGSTVILVKGTYDDAFELCLKAAKEYGWYNRNTGYNPYMSEGKKTAAFEICEQMNWKAPDAIFVSVGDGCIIGGLYKGLKDLYRMGWIDKVPKLIGVQAEGSDFLYQAWKSGEDVLNKKPIQADTVADSISAGLPRDRLKAMAAVNETDGAFIVVSDEEILKAIPELAGKSGIFAEPAGAASYAGLKKSIENNIVSQDESVVILVTGNGLKDTASAMKSTELYENRAYHVEPEIGPVKKIVAGMGLE